MILSEGAVDRGRQELRVIVVDNYYSNTSRLAHCVDLLREQHIPVHIFGGQQCGEFGRDLSNQNRCCVLR